jgi:hypothetical protein
MVDSYWQEKTELFLKESPSQCYFQHYKHMEHHGGAPSLCTVKMGTLYDLKQHSTTDQSVSALKRTQYVSVRKTKVLMLSR